MQVYHRSRWKNRS